MLLLFSKPALFANTKLNNGPTFVVAQTWEEEVAKELSRRGLHLGANGAGDAQCSGDLLEAHLRCVVATRVHPVFHADLYVVIHREGIVGAVDLLLAAVSYTHLTLPTNREV